MAFGISKHPLAASVDHPLTLPKRKSKLSSSSSSSKNVVESFPRVAQSQSKEARDHDIHVVLLNYFCDSKGRDLRPLCRAMDKLVMYEKCKSYIYKDPTLKQVHQEGVSSNNRSLAVARLKELLTERVNLTKIGCALRRDCIVVASSPLRSACQKRLTLLS